MIIVLLELLQLRIALLDRDSFPRKPHLWTIALNWLLGMEKERFAEATRARCTSCRPPAIGEDHLGIYPLLLHHRRHILCCQEVRYASKFLSGDKSNFVVLQSVPGRVDFEGVVVEGVGEEVVDEGAEGETPM